MTLQTLVVLLIGAAYRWQLGVATVIAYLGLAPLVGPRPDISSVSLRRPSLPAGG